MEKGAKIAFALRGPFGAAKKNVCEGLSLHHFAAGAACLEERAQALTGMAALPPARAKRQNLA